MKSFNVSVSKTNEWESKNYQNINENNLEKLLMSSYEEKNITPRNSLSKNISRILKSEKKIELCKNKRDLKSKKSNLKFILYSPYEKNNQIKFEKKYKSEIENKFKSNNFNNNLNETSKIKINKESSLLESLAILKKKNLSLVSDLSLKTNTFFDCSKSSIAQNEIILFDVNSNDHSNNEFQSFSNDHSNTDVKISILKKNYFKNTKDLIYKEMNSSKLSSIEVSDLQIVISKNN